MPVFPELIPLIEQGRLCSFCGDDIRTNVPDNKDDQDDMTKGDGLGAVTLCADCTATGNDPEGYLK